ncbi:Prophage antirepressor, partial [Clostridium cadaveris]
MNNLMIFENKPVEVFELNGQVLFNPYHCGECLDISPEGVRKAITRMNQKQVIKLKNSDVTISNIRKLNNAGENFLTESGVYKLIFKSKKKEAERFQDWVTDEVLPQIRKTGSYKSNQNSINPELKEKEIEARLKNARAREANILLKICSNPNLSKEYVQVLQSKATEIITGQAILPLPVAERKTYSATEIG